LNAKGESEKMRKDFLLLATMVFFVLLVSPVFAKVNVDNYPRLDTIISKECSDETDMITKASSGILDTAYDIRRPANVKTLQDIGWSISTNDGYSFHYWGVNCRTVTTPESGSYYDYHGRTPGQPVFFPLNVSKFRFALHLLIGGSVTDNALSATFGWTQKRIDTIPAPAAGQWYNTELPPMPYDPAQAMAILNSIGFSNTTAGHVGYWWNSNSTTGPVGELRTIYVLGCPEALTSTTAMSYAYQASWNHFFGKKSDGTSNYFDFDLIPWVTMGDIVWMERDFDIEGSGWQVGRDPDYLFDFFHSSKDGVDDYNMIGIHNAQLDEKIFAVKYWRWPNGTYITTVDDLIKVAWAAEEMLYYLTPYMVKYCAVATNAFAPGLKSWVESLGYGSDIGASYNWIYWGSDLTKTSINQANSGPISTLNPAFATTVYDWAILNRLYDGLYDIEPFLHKDINWAMSGYTIAPWIESALGVQYGQKVTVTLRHGIYWQSGDPVTSADIKFDYDFIKHMELGRYSDIVLTYYNTTIIDDYHFSIYLNCTGIWTVYVYFADALLFPQEIWQPWWDDPSGAQAWTPWTVKYDTWTGKTGHGDLTCLIGTGAWIFHDRDAAAGSSTLFANRANAMYTGNPGYWAGKFLREDVDFSGRIDIIDLATAGAAFGAKPGHPRWAYARCDIDSDLEVTIIDLARIAKHWYWVTLPD
jgi:ABC-type transport system substrate-binding protein